MELWTCVCLFSKYQYLHPHVHMSCPLLWCHQQQTSCPRTSLGTSWPPPETQQGPPCHLSISEIFWHQTHKLELSGWTWQISKQNRRPNVTSCPQALIYPAIHIIMHAHTNLISILSWAPRILLYVQIEICKLIIQTKHISKTNILNVLKSS